LIAESKPSEESLSKLEIYSADLNSELKISGKTSQKSLETKRFLRKQT